MKIKMKETVQGSIDGVTVQELVVGQIYDTIDSPRGRRLALYHVETMACAAYVPEALPSTTDSHRARGKQTPRTVK